MYLVKCKTSILLLTANIMTLSELAVLVDTGMQVTVPCVSTGLVPPAARYASFLNRFNLPILEGATATDSVDRLPGRLDTLEIQNKAFAQSHSEEPHPSRVTTTIIFPSCRQLPNKLARHSTQNLLIPL